MSDICYNCFKHIDFDYKMKTQTVKLGFTPSMCRKMLKGGAVQMSLPYLQGSEGESADFVVPKKLSTRINRALKNGKAMRIRLSDMESPLVEGSGMLADGGSVRDFFKRVGSALKKGYNVLKPILAPIVKKAVQTGADLVESKVGAYLPEESKKGLSQLKDKAVDKLGEVSGAFGMVPMYGGMVPMYGGFMPMVQGTMHPAIYPGHPAFNSLVAPGFGELGSYVPSSVSKPRGKGFRVI